VEEPEHDRLRIVNSILWGNSPAQIESLEGEPSASYSNIQGGWPGDGNINADPQFVLHSSWDPNGTPDDPSDDVFVEGDYHLRSEAGRWDSSAEQWVFDDITSPCIDAGDPTDPVAFEPFRNGATVNMGVYGGTVGASKSISGIHGTYGGGSGEPNDPYLVYTPEHLNTIGTEPNDWDKHFRLMTHVDLGAYTGTEFNPIGTDWGSYFTGVFDGNGYTIANLQCIDRGRGLFTTVSDPNAKIMNLGLINPHVDAGEWTSRVGPLVGSFVEGTLMNCYTKGGFITGESAVGGLVGYNGGTITNCFATCAVAAMGRGPYCGTVGGLVASNGGTVSNSYSGSTVAGSSPNGGLIGVNNGAIMNCHAFGLVVDTYIYGAAGLVGRDNGAVTGCFWDTQTSEQAESTGGTGLTTAEMQKAATFLDAGWDFIDETENGTDDIWWIDEGQDYPRLWWERGDESPL
jgi:hypothetical protein